MPYRFKSQGQDCLDMWIQKELNQLSDAIVASPVRNFERRVKRRWYVWAGQTRKALSKESF